METYSSQSLSPMDHNKSVLLYFGSYVLALMLEEEGEAKDDLIFESNKSKSVDDLFVLELRYQLEEKIGLLSLALPNSPTRESLLEDCISQAFQLRLCSPALFPDQRLQVRLISFSLSRVSVCWGLIVVCVFPGFTVSHTESADGKAVRSSNNRSSL